MSEPATPPARLLHNACQFIGTLLGAQRQDADPALMFGRKGDSRIVVMNWRQSQAGIPRSVRLRIRHRSIRFHKAVAGYDVLLTYRIRLHAIQILADLRIPILNVDPP